MTPRHFVPVAATALALLTGAPVLAQGVEGFSYSGIARLGLVDGDGPFDTLRYGAFDLNAEYATNGGFGVGLDAFGFVDLERTEDPLEYFNVYGFYETDTWRVSLGHTQSASELLLSERRLGFDYSLDFEVSVSFESFVDQLYLFNETIYGVTYEADYGDLEVAASLHASDDFDDAVLGIAARGHVGEGIYLSGGAEVLTDAPSGTDPTLRIGAGYAGNGITVDALLTSAPSFIPDATLFTLDGRYEIPQLQGLTVGASFLNLSFFGNDTQFYGLGASYTHASGFGVEANANVDDDGDARYAAEINFRF